jgi:hypothetical protein
MKLISELTPPPSFTELPDIYYQIPQSIDMRELEKTAFEFTSN